MAQSALTWEFEKTAFGQGKIVCGTDEAGRGPLAGRVYAAAVVLDTDDSQNPVLLELNDSKKLTEKKRFSLEDPIKNISKSWCVAYSTVEEIESTDILSASLHAMSRAIQGLGIDRSLDEKTLESMCISGVGGKPITPDGVLVDGCINRGFSIPAKAIIGGDAKCFTIAAASILAKCERDRYCIEYLDKNFPQYEFAKHKGYGTKAHYQAVDKYGLCIEHRKSFFKKYFQKKAQGQ